MPDEEAQDEYQQPEAEQPEPDYNDGTWYVPLGGNTYVKKVQE